MANFQRKQNPFLHRGLWWNAPAEKIPDGMLPWAKNIRILEQGTVSAAYGETLVYGPLTGTVFGQIPGSTPAPGGGFYAQYLHSMQRLNILNTTTDVPGATGIFKFDQYLRRSYVLGADNWLYVFQDNRTLLNAAVNPTPTPGTPVASQITGVPIPDQNTVNTLLPFSGNPLSIVDAMPVAGIVSWKYIGDSNQMCTVGYYTGDGANVHPARCLTMGMTPPVNLTLPEVFSSNPNLLNSASPDHNPGRYRAGGKLTGSYQWFFVYRRLETGARSNPSAATRQSVSAPATSGNNFPGATANSLAYPFQVNLAVPVTPIDPQTGGPDTHIVVDVYRFGGNVFRWALVGTSVPGGGGTFTDNKSDLELLAAPSPSQTTDASTGLTRFNLFRPFIVQDVKRAGSDAITIQSQINGTWRVVIGQASVTPGPPGSHRPPNPGNISPDHAFKLDWLPGSILDLDGFAATIYQVIDDHTIEILEDLTGTTTSGATHDWSTPAGTLLAGQPLPHLWGVYGLGQGGSYIFGCGDTNAPSTLYWTNGNDPDSMDVVNSLIVTSPSERLQTGCIYQGNPYCWTTERMFQIYPSYTVFGQFTVQEVSGARGVWMEWSLSVQNNGFADVSVTWRGKDGIYDYSGGVNRISDPLFAFFPHDGAPGLAPETIMPFIGANSEHPESVGNIDDTQPKYHRLTWFHGELFYDFVALTLNPDGSGRNTFSTLVFDSVNIPGGGWVSLDQKFADTVHPIARSVEVGAIDLQARDDLLPDASVGGPMTRGGNMKVTWGPIIYDYAGYQRDLFECRVITKAEDLGDSRSPKLWGDFWLDCTPLNSFSVTPLVDFNNIALATLPVPPAGLTQLSGTRQEFVMDFAEWVNAGGKGQLGPSLGLDIRWQPINGQFVATLYQVTYTFIVKPDFIAFRATDPDDQGANQAKYLMAMNIEANTLGKDVPINVIVDNQVIAHLLLNHPYQNEKPYAFEPVAGYEFQVQLQFPDPNTLWELFKINWIFEPWPDAVARKYPFTNLGDSSDKFIQGIVLPMETGGQPAVVGVWGDDDNAWHYWTKTTPNLKKMGIDLNIEQPFTAHILQFQTLTASRIWPDEARVVYEPIPEATNTWQTQQTDNDLGGWSHLRDCFIAYMGGTGSNLATPLAGPIMPVLTITTEYGSMQYDLDPVMPNQYVRCYRVLAPQKAKWHQFRVEAPLGGVRLYQKDSVIRIKEWGSNGPYINSQPFGDNSRASGARM